MKHLPELQSAFDAVDDWTDDQLKIAQSAPWKRRRLINQEAYFVLAWGQLEREIDEACRDFIRKRRADLRWEQRRGFDIYNPEDRRLSGLAFDERVRLVIENDGERSKTLKHYELRNLIAHGKAFATGIDFDDVVRDLYVISSAISR